LADSHSNGRSRAATTLLLARLGPIYVVGAILAHYVGNHAVGVARQFDGQGGATEMMTMSWQALIVMIVIAAVCGAVAKALAGGTQGGLISSIALGFIGALLGPWLAHQLNLSEPFVVHVAGRTFPIVWSIIGAAMFVAVLHLFSRRRSRLHI
jgi:uncharacterized membrane protein YeaQ/YmgE (transglycosylase-associated protein family)